MRVLLAELAPVLGDPGANLVRIRDTLAAARCDLAVFPELFLSGYRVGDRFHEIALSAGDPSIDALRAVARERHAAIVVGAPMRSTERAGEIHNSALLVDQDGATSSQVKRFLPTFGPFEEGIHFTPAATSQPVRSGGRSLGLEICYDAFFPEVSRDLALAGAELLVAISAAPVSSRRLFEKVLPARAIENALPLVYVNRVGVEDGLVFGGGSIALDPRGEAVETQEVNLAGLESDERVVTVELDLAHLPRWRPFRPVVRDAAGSRAATGPRASASPGSAGPADASLTSSARLIHPDSR
ncbi:MAG: carbon-nitrogen hydrolase family protein [Thermoplasmata archaeon]|nr:carbon-nitrogen hydrolase family protein [Thermoplasmata archaeon]